MNPQRRRPRAVAAAVALTAVAATAAAPTAASAATTGATTIDLGGAVARSLRSQGVTISARKPARATRKTITLPVAAGRVANAATLQHRGSVTFRTRSGRRTRTATFTGWQTRLAPRKSTITAKLGGQRVPLFTIAAPRRRVGVDKAAGVARLAHGTVRLTSAGATALRRQLAIRDLSAGRLGTADVNAQVTVPRSAPAPAPAPAPSPTPAPTPAPTPPPATQTPITSASITWWLRDSFVRYISAGEGVFPTNGAVAGQSLASSGHVCADRPPDADPGALVYAYSFPFKSGWQEINGAAATVTGSGALRFSYRSHTIDFTVSEPEIELIPGAARVFAHLSGTGGTAVSGRKALMDLDLASATRTVDGNRVTYSPIRGRVPAGTDSLFAGFYGAGDPFGCVVVSYTTG